MKTFKEQFDKLTEGYINGKVDPYVSCACFVGNLLGSGEWSGARKFTCDTIQIDDSKLFKDDVEHAKRFINSSGYNVQEIIQLEDCFLRTIRDNTYPNCNLGDAWFYSDSDDREYFIDSHPNYENALFIAFEKTLDLLKEIHESKGEVVDEFVFVKRSLIDA